MAAVRHIKVEPPDEHTSAASSSELTQAEIEARISALCQEFPKGITDKVLQNDMPSLGPKQRVTAINKLLAMGHLDLFKQGNELIYKWKGSDEMQKVKGADNEEKVVFRIIEEAGNKGIWIRDIRFKSNLPLTQLNKILKALESKKLIKAVKSVSATKKKVYMLYNLEPDQSVTGGSWYSDQDFESEFVDVLNQQCFRFLQQKLENSKGSKQGPIAACNMAYASSKDIWKYISELGISKVQLSLDDIETILNTLIYDGKVERNIVAAGNESAGGDGQVKLYRAVETLLPPTGLMRMPCGVCPVIKDCCDIGSINAKKCIYLKEWLD